MLNGVSAGASLHQGIDLASTEHAPIEYFEQRDRHFYRQSRHLREHRHYRPRPGHIEPYGHMSAIQVTEGAEGDERPDHRQHRTTGWAGGADHPCGISASW